MLHHGEPLAAWQAWRRERDAELDARFGASCPVFPPSPRWVVTADWQAYPRPRWETVGTADGRPRPVPVHGRLRFRLDGAEYTLEPYSSGPPGRLNVAFRDTTSGHTTYPVARVVFPALPRPGEACVVIDFNRAINPPCAFTAAAACAFPPPGNVLPVPVEAGEKLPLALPGA
jgi:uncharacterized protein (DUF1684 family)